MAASKTSVKSLAKDVQEYADELERAHKEREKIKDVVFEVDLAIAALVNVRKQLKNQLG